MQEWWRRPQRDGQAHFHLRDARIRPTRLAARINKNGAATRAGGACARRQGQVPLTAAFRRALLFLLGLLTVLSGCARQIDAQPVVDDIRFQSAILGKEMLLKVYKPASYCETRGYPVLYFFPDGGGSVYTVMDQYGLAEKAEKLILEGRIEPLLIVAVDIDRSFGVNSAETVETIETSSGKQFEKGMYEDCFIKEIIPYIDSRYSTEASGERRYVGGYSMGGFAALHIALRNPGLFSKAGGHSPSIFKDEFPDKTVSDFLYPTQELRKERDPVYLVQSRDVSSLEIFLDVESGGSSGVKYLYDTALEYGADVQFQYLSYSHSRFSCAENMENYLLFYAQTAAE